VRRNRTSAVIAGLAIAVVVLLGAGLSVWQAIRASRSEVKARQAELQAEREAETAKAVLGFLQDDLLSLADPSRGDANRPRDRDLKLLTAINLAAHGVGERFKDQPLVEAGVRLTLANTYGRLGQLDAAEPHLERALALYNDLLGPDDLQTLEAVVAKAWWLLNKSQFDQAISLIQPAIEVRQRLRGADHNATLEAIHCLAEAQLARGNNAEALRLVEDLVQRARQSSSAKPETLLGALSTYAWVHFQLGDRERWVQLNQERLQSARERLGNDHPSTLDAMLAVESGLRLILAEVDEAEKLALQAHERAARVLGEDHGLTISILSEMALLAAAKGLGGEYMQMRTNLAELSHRAIGSEDPWATFEQMRLGDALQSWGYFESAESLLDADYLAAARQSWKPIKDLIEKADWRTRRMDWVQAKELLLQAMSHEYFDWEAAAHQFHGLADKAAALFVLTRDWEPYGDLCHRLLRVGEFGPAGVPGPLLLSGDRSPSELQHPALVLARRTAQTRRSKAHQTRWHDLTLGMAEYRNGNLPDALLALGRAQSAYNLNCSGIARAFAAMAQWDSDRPEEARRLVKEAEDFFQQVRDGHQGDLGPWWHPVATFEISLAETREHVR
jgi:tetratricopeptide (TPR) repeat protein